MADQLDIYDQALDQLQQKSAAPDTPGAPEVDIYDQAIKQLQSDAVSKTKQSIIENSKSGVDPARQAEAIKISKEQGIPVEAAYDNLDELRQKPGPNLDQLVTETPVTAKTLADPIKGKVTFTDYEPLSEMERAFRDLGTPQMNIDQEYRKGVSDRVWSWLGSNPTEAMFGQAGVNSPETRDAETKARIDQAVKEGSDAVVGARQAMQIADNERAWRIANDPNYLYGGPEWDQANLTKSAAKQQLTAAQENLAFAKDNPVTMTALRNDADVALGIVNKLFWSAVKSVGDTHDTLNKLAAENPTLSSILTTMRLSSPTGMMGIPEDKVDDKGRTVVSQVADQGLANAEVRFPADPGRQRDLQTEIVSGVASSIPFYLAGGVGKLVGLSPGFVAGVLGALTEAGGAAEDADKHGATGWQKLFSMAVAAGGGTLEAVPVERAWKWLEEAPLKSVAANLFTKFAANAANEVPVEMTQTFLEDIVPKMTFDPNRDILGDMGQAGRAAFFTSILVGAAGHVSQVYAERQRDRLKQIGDAINRAKTMEIAPGMMTEFIQNLKDAGVAPEHVTAPVEAVKALFQELDPEAQKAVYGEFLTRMEEARQTGAEVTIPTEKLAELAKLKGYTTFTDKIRIGDNPTVEEVIKQRKDFDQLVERMAAEEGQSAEPSPVFTTIRDQLVKAGQSADTAAPMARIYESFFTTQAERIGMDPVELLRRYGLEITNSEITAEQMAPQLEQLRKEWADPTRPETPAGAVASQSSPASTIPDTTSLRSQLAAAGITPQALAGMTNEQVTQTLAERTLAQAKNRTDYRQTAGVDYSAPLNEVSVSTAEGNTVGLPEGVKTQPLALADGTPVTVSSKSLGKLQRFIPKTAAVRKAVLAKLPEVVAASKIFAEAPDSDGNAAKSWRYAASVVDVDGQKYLVQLSLEEAAGAKGEKIYALHGFEAEPVGAQSGASVEGNAFLRPPTGSIPVATAVPASTLSDSTQAPNTTLYQGGAAPTNARGFITFNQARDKFRITLTGNANLSTFLHESGHFFLEVMQDLVEKGIATDQQRADLEILRSWMGLKPGEKIGVKQHEQFARGTEAYFMEGKAPSNELVSAFQRFKSWLTFVYRSLAGLNVKLTDEVRGVMDRLLASDQAIAEARAQVGWRGAPMSQQETGLTDAEYKTYTEAWIKANDAQSHDADARVLLEAARELKKVWRDEKIALTNQMQEELAKTRGYRAWQLLTNGEGLADVLPNAADLKITPDSIPQEWKRDAQGMTSPPYEAGLPLDYVAELLGFDSGEQMLALIAGAKAAQKAIPAKVRAAMEAKHGRMDANALATEAAKAVHNKPTMDVLLTEFRAMASKAGQNVPKQIGAILAAQAKAKVAELTQRQLQPTKWRRAELKAAHEAGQAAGRGDAQGAFLAKRRQMVAASMVKATLDAQDRVEKIRDYLSTFQTDRRRAQLGKAGEMYLDGVDQILENLELKDVSLKLLKKRPLLQDIVQKAIEEDEPINIPAEILGMGKRNYSQLTLGELEAVHDAVKNLWTLAKLKNQLKSRQGKIQLDKAMEQIAATADAFLGEKRQPDTLNPTAIDKAIGKLRWVRAKLVKMEFLFSWLDGRPDGGLAHQLIYQPIADARAAEYKLMEDMAQRILDPIRNMPREQRQRWDTKRTFMGQTMKGANIIAVALNMGNEQNKTKLLQGYGWNENLVMAELNQFMTKADWDMVQQIWDAIDSLWPHIERTAKNATGLAPDRVVPSPVTTPHGQYSGGYYPIVYDPFRTQKVAERQEAKASANGLFANNFLRPTLDNGFTKKRTGYVAPIYLSLDVLSQHLAETIHYVTHYEAVKQADKIRSHPVFQELVTRNMGREFWAELRPWLQDVANNVTQRRYPEFGETAMRHIRVGTTVAAMGFNIGTALKQTFGIATSLVAVSPRYWASGVHKAWMSPSIEKNWRFALKESQELRQLIHDFDRDVKQINDTFAMSLGKKFRASILQKAFLHIGAMQLTVNVATWHGAYEQALARGDSHEMAVIHADSVVRKTQGGGNIKDLADVQRSGEATKMLTMFYSYFSVVYNQLEDISKNTKSVKDIPSAASKIVMLSIVPTLLNMGYEAGKAALFGGGDDGEDEDQQSFITSLMLESVNQLVGAVPLLRNMISFGDHGGGVNLPTISKFEQMVRSYAAITNTFMEGEAPSRKQIRTMVDVVSVLTKLPISPMYKLIDDAIGANIEE